MKLQEGFFVLKKVHQKETEWGRGEGLKMKSAKEPLSNITLEKELEL